MTIELLLCEVLGIDRIGIYSQFEKPLSTSELDKLREMVVRKGNREPLQYIIGKTSFYGIELLVNKSVLIPRPETELLVEAVLNLAKSRDGDLKILDIGSGSGCIAIALAKHLPTSKIIAIDISDEALDTARKNAEMNGVGNIRFERGNILKSMPEDKFFDIIVSNPPYITAKDYGETSPEVRNNEPKIALTDGNDGLTFYKRYAEIFPKLLSPEGVFFLELGYDQADRISAIFLEKEYNLDFISDYGKIRRIAFNLTDN